MTVVWLGDPIKVSNSEIQVWKDCRRRWFLQYYRQLGWKRENQEASGVRGLGSRVHLCLERFYEMDRNRKQLTAAGAQLTDDSNKHALTILAEIYEGDREALRALNREVEIVELDKEHALAYAMIEGYLEWAEEAAIDAGMTLVESEGVLETVGPVEGVTLRAKLDQRWVRDIDGAKLFRDYKTVQDLTTPAQILPLDEQMPFYHLLEYIQSKAESEVTGETPVRTDGGLYTMLRKVKRTATAKPPFYGQVPVSFNQAKLLNTWTAVAKVIEEIVITRQGLDAGADHHYMTPKRPSRDCTWKCDFFLVCGMMDDGSNAEGAMQEFYTVIDPHIRYEQEDLKGTLAS